MRTTDWLRPMLLLPLMGMSMATLAEHDYNFYSSDAGTSAFVGKMIMKSRIDAAMQDDWTVLEQEVNQLKTIVDDTAVTSSATSSGRGIEQLNENDRRAMRARLNAISSRIQAMESATSPGLLQRVQTWLGYAPDPSQKQHRYGVTPQGLAAIKAFREQLADVTEDRSDNARERLRVLVDRYSLTRRPAMPTPEKPSEIATFTYVSLAPSDDEQNNP